MAQSPEGGTLSSDEYGEERRPRRRRRRSGSSSRRHHRGERYDEGQLERVDAPDAGADVRPPDGAHDGRPEISIRTLRLIGLALLALVVIGGGGWYYYEQVTSPAARQLAEARNMPLVGMVMSDQPDAAKRLRAAIEEDVSKPGREGPSRESAVVSELRSEYIAPTLRRADDASLIATMDARARFAEHLNKTDTKVCREFGLGGLQHPETLDPEGQRLYKNVLSAVEAAYRSGRAAKDAPPVPTLQQVGAMLSEAGFVKSDFDKLNSFATLSNDITCYIVLKVNQVVPRLKPEERGPYARFILGN